MIHEYIKIVIILIITVLFIKEIVQYKSKGKFNKVILVLGIYILFVYLSIFITIMNERQEYVQTKEMISQYVEVYTNETITKESLEDEIKSEYYNDKEIGNSGETQKEYIDRLIRYKNGEIESLYEYENELDQSTRDLGFGRKDEKVEEITELELGKLVMVDYRDGKEREYGKVYREIYKGEDVSMRDLNEEFEKHRLPLFLKGDTKRKIYAQISPWYKEYKEKNDFAIEYIGSESTHIDLSTLIALDIARDNGVFAHYGDYEMPEELADFLGSQPIEGSTKTAEEWLKSCYSEAKYVMYGDPSDNTTLDSIADY